MCFLLTGKCKLFIVSHATILPVFAFANALFLHQKTVSQLFCLPCILFFECPMTQNPFQLGLLLISN